MSPRRALPLAAAVLALAVAGAGASLHRALAPLRPDAEPTSFEVPRGSTLGSIARNLERRAIVRSARAVEWLARLRGISADLQAGEYRLSASLSPGEILDILASGRVVTHEVVLPEGLTAVEIAQRLEAAGLTRATEFVALARDPASAARFGVEGPTLEGYLFPDTYRMPRNLTPSQIAQVLMEQFLRVWNEISAAAAAQGLSMREVATLASIVEKETSAPQERPLIAGVFRNRLALGMRLESDPTVIYGIPDFDGNLKRVHLLDSENPYNTYQRSGLPPGPIANPGADSLRAVVSPADTDYLFFVSRNDGTHIFSRSYREHVNNVNRFQKRRGH
ncbi:MAG: endolytic transglycosylase MltG [Deltaproteobacteria bacterium]|nr:MAG: endolytic transglycosylase MltG [Deltaproteobacteria bacterium]